MRIQINSDKTIAVDTRVIRFVKGEVNRALKAHTAKLTRVEVHLSDVNGDKLGTNDKRCRIEARPARHKPVLVSSRSPTVRQAVGGALTKLRSGLETFFGRLEKQVADTVAEARPTARRTWPRARQRGPFGEAIVRGKKQNVRGPRKSQSSLRGQNRRHERPDVPSAVYACSHIGRSRWKVSTVLVGTRTARPSV